MAGGNGLVLLGQKGLPGIEGESGLVGSRGIQGQKVYI
jgi:hypothetical protein